MARSIRASGIVQPLVARKIGNRFQLIAGERRWRAAQRAGLRRVPAVIRHVAEEMALEMTLVENLQREDLNPIEQANAFQRLMDEFHLTQEEVADRTGKHSVRLLPTRFGFSNLKTRFRSLSSRENYPPATAGPCSASPTRRRA